MKKIEALYRRIQDYPKFWPEIVVVITYMCLHIIVSFFHEPWYDEAVAWLIARDSSIRDILFLIPHYEGHPSLWHLILVPFAKTGMPYELSLTIISLFFTITAVWLIQKYAPFPRIVKWTLPFTYFFFYQYGVIARPYCVMMLAIVLLSMAHKIRNEGPVYYVGALALLCSTSAYGIVIAGGIAFAWLLEIKSGKKLVDFMKHMWKDSRVRALFGLLIWAIFLCFLLVPSGDVYAVKKSFEMRKFQYFVYTYLVMLPDSMCSFVYDNFERLQLTNIDEMTLFLGVILGCAMLWLLFCYTLPRNTFGYFIFSYSAFSSFATLVYIYPHHIGICNYLLLFIFWISEESKDVETRKVVSQGKVWDGVPDGLKQNIKILKSTFCSYLVGISVFWSLFSSVLDVKYQYCGARNISRFIKENHLEEYKIMAEWGQETDENGKVTEDYINLLNGYNVLPYFENPIFVNGPCGTDGNYVLHKTVSEEDTKKWYRKMQQEGIPDVLVGVIPLNSIYGEEVDFSEEYRLVYRVKSGLIWKGEWFFNYDCIYVREKLAEELGLKDVTRCK